MDTTYEKQGYLYDDFRMFHVKDHEKREFHFHYHDFYKILFFIKGKVTYNVEGKNYNLRPYDMVLISQGEIHKPDVSFDEPYERVIFYISKEWFKRYQTEDYDMEYCFKRALLEKKHVVRFPALENTAFMDIIKRIEEKALGDSYASKLYGDALFLEFLIELNRCCLDGRGSFEQLTSCNSKMIEIMDYINSHLKERLDVEHLAEQFYISKYHMMRAFKKETGYSVHQYITEKRILLAKKLIDSGMSAGNACLECGFRDYSAFSRAFKSRLAQPPTGNEKNDRV